MFDKELSIPALLEDQPWLKQSAILAWRGSVADGTYRDPEQCENSFCDLDLISVIIPDSRFFYGIDTWASRGTKEYKKGEWDIVAYDIRKTIHLLEKGNPNILSLLYLDEADYLRRTMIGHLLIEARDLFKGKHVLKSFVGYANNQLYKMTHTAGNGYMGAKRKELVAKFGYDTKNAAHTIRLLRMCKEYFQSGGHITVKRPDRDLLLSIKDGHFPKEKILEAGEALIAECKVLCDASSLPERPDHATIDKLCCDLVRESLMSSEL